MADSHTIPPLGVNNLRQHPHPQFPDSKSHQFGFERYEDHSSIGSMSAADARSNGRASSIADTGLSNYTGTVPSSFGGNSPKARALSSGAGARTSPLPSTPATKGLDPQDISGIGGSFGAKFELPLRSHHAHEPGSADVAHTQADDISVLNLTTRPLHDGSLPDADAHGVHDKPAQTHIADSKLPVIYE
jgi:hypothetical protein